MTVTPHDLLPMFTVRNALDGVMVRYENIWQQRNLVLVLARKDDLTAAEYTNALIAATSPQDAADTTFVSTSNRIPGLPFPGAVVADRWGEIYYVKTTSQAAGLPTVEDLAEWLRYVRQQCPECQGEAR
jgi:hypothetical protein